MKLQSLVIVVAVLGVLGYFGYKAYNQFTNEKPERELLYFGPIKKEQDSTVVYHSVADFKFLDQDSNEVTPANFEGKIYVTDFFFTTCETICPIMSKQMQRVVKTFENEPRVAFLSHTVEPEYDSVSILKDYAKEHEADSKVWHFVTGPKPELYRMARESYFLVDSHGDGGPDDFIHTERFALIDMDQHIRGYYDGTDSADVDKLINEMKLLLKYYDYKAKQ